jgi:Cdc6-like AAA superfamily ATPase
VLGYSLQGGTRSHAVELTRRELCENSVRGFPGAVVRSFDTYAAATNYIAEYCLFHQCRNGLVPTVHGSSIEPLSTITTHAIGTSQAATSTAHTSQRSLRQSQFLPLFTDADCSEEQRKVLALVSQGANIFVTGSAGVGKSFVIQKICQLFESKGLQSFSDFFVTASTGTIFKVVLII